MVVKALSNSTLCNSLCRKTFFCSSVQTEQNPLWVRALTQKLLCPFADEVPKQFSVGTRSNTGIYNPLSVGHPVMCGMSPKAVPCRW